MAADWAQNKNLSVANPTDYGAFCSFSWCNTKVYIGIGTILLYVLSAGRFCNSCAKPFWYNSDSLKWISLGKIGQFCILHYGLETWRAAAVSILLISLVMLWLPGPGLLSGSGTRRRLSTQNMETYKYHKYTIGPTRAPPIPPRYRHALGGDTGRGCTTWITHCRPADQTYQRYIANRV